MTGTAIVVVMGVVVVVVVVVVVAVVRGGLGGETHTHIIQIQIHTVVWH